MSDVRAGVAYVDVRLGSIEQFKDKLKAEIEGVTQEVSRRVGEKMAKEMAPEGAKVGKVTAATMSKAFFADAGQSFGSGFKSLFKGQFSEFGRQVKEAGVASGLGFREAFNSGIAGISTGFRKAGQGIQTAASSIRASVISTFDAMPGRIAAAGQAVDAFGKRMGFLSFQLTNFGFIASTAFTAPVAAILGFGAVIGIKTAVQIENATAALKSLTPAGTDVEALIKRLQKLALESPIFNSADLITFTQRMVASGLKIQEVEAFLKSFGNIALTVGADVSKIPFALEALVQMAGKGNVSMEELRLQLGDALPGTMEIVSKALGVTTAELYEMVKAGKLTGKELIAALTEAGQAEKYLKGAAAGAETMSAKWQELKESVQNQLGKVFLENSDQIKKALEDLGPVTSDFIKEVGPVFPTLIKGFGDFIKKIGELINWYQNLSPEMQDLINKLILGAIVFGPIILLLGLFGTALAGISALVAAVATPVGAVIAAIILFGIAAWGLIVKLKNMYNEGGKFREAWDALWAKIMELVKPLREEWDKTWPKIKEGFDQLKNAFKSVSDGAGGTLEFFKGLGKVLLLIFGPGIALVWGIIKGLISGIGDLFKAVTSLISGIIKFLGGLITFLSGVFTGDWSKAWEGIKLMWDGLWDAIVGTIVNVLKAIINFVKGFVTGIVDFFTWLWDILVGHSIVPDMVNAILAWFKRMVDRGVAFVKSLGKPFLDFYNNHIKPFVAGIGRGVDNALEFIRELPGRIRKFFADAGSWLISAGRNIVNGLIEGVRRMGGALRNAILDLIPGPVRGIVENALGIKSPSRVFAQYGKFTVQGFIEGIRGQQMALEGVMAGTFGGLQPERITPFYGDARSPAVEARGAGPALNIENYNEAHRSPDEVAEDLWLKIVSRGGGV